MRNATRISGKEARRSAPIFAALGDETRLRMLSRLAQSGPMSITSLTAGTGVTRQAVTKHLRRMEYAGLLQASRLGRERVWEVDPASLDVAEQYLRTISDQWDAALGRLKAFVES
ncbi:MAG TPA: metalloregulator ArsR/SmtB family transcription factor [Gemmatimonadaceae bacterium]|nr:metalloregulator ArsR/SmtB family transcription factor [Gemmatimonadaceae bacterium]